VAIAAGADHNVAIRGPLPVGVTSSPPPAQFLLRQNIPNPFNPSTSIGYRVPVGGDRVSLRVYDVGGRLVRVLVDGFVTGGTRFVTWDGTDTAGHRVTSGVYFYRLTGTNFERSLKMVLLK
jgi:hypothetical protein